MKAYVLIKLQTGEIVEALHQLRRLKGVVSADMTFGPYDAVATIEAPDLKSVGQVVAADIQPVIGVLDTLTCLVVDVE